MYRKWEQISRIRQDVVVVVVVFALDNAAINCPDKWVIKIIKFSLHSTSRSPGIVVKLCSSGSAQKTQWRNLSTCNPTPSKLCLFNVTVVCNAAVNNNCAAIGFSGSSGELLPLFWRRVH